MCQVPGQGPIEAPPTPAGYPRESGPRPRIHARLDGPAASHAVRQQPAGRPSRTVSCRGWRRTCDRHRRRRPSTPARASGSPVTRCGRPSRTRPACRHRRPDLPRPPGLWGQLRGPACGQVARTASGFARGTPSERQVQELASGPWRAASMGEPGNDEGRAWERESARALPRWIMSHRQFGELPLSGGVIRLAERTLRPQRTVPPGPAVPSTSTLRPAAREFAATRPLRHAAPKVNARSHDRHGRPGTASQLLGRDWRSSVERCPGCPGCQQPCRWSNVRLSRRTTRCLKRRRSTKVPLDNAAETGPLCDVRAALARDDRRGPSLTQHVPIRVGVVDLVVEQDVVPAGEAWDGLDPDRGERLRDDIVDVRVSGDDIARVTWVRRPRQRCRLPPCPRSGYPVATRALSADQGISGIFARPI